MRLSILRLVPLATASTLILGVACSSSDDSSNPQADAATDSATQDVVTDSGSDSGMCTAAQYQWATSGGGPGQGDDVNGVAVDSSGNAWVTGTFTGTATWGSTTLSAVDTVHTTAFFAKLDPTGKVLLARAIQGAGDGGTGGLPNIGNVGSRIRVDSSGNAYIAGHFEKQIDIDDVHLVENDTGNGSVFVLKVDSTGKAVWGQANSSGGDGMAATDLSLDASGNVFVTGEFNGPISFGALNSNHQSSDKAMFVAEYSQSTSSWVWLKTYAGQVDATNDGAVGTGIVTTSDGNVYVTGTIAVTTVVDGTLLTNDGDSFLAKLSAADGSLQWVTPLVSTDTAATALQTSALTVDGSNDVFVTGQFRGTATFSGPSSPDGGTDAGGVSVTTAGGGVDMFVAEYSASGAAMWAKHAGDPT
ncbi:MAG: hypothetical protein ACRELY_09670, partial [Polyangiaceae bacterium]